MITGPVPPEEAQRSAIQSLWTFPSVLASAFVVAWGAEAAQFSVSQGLALAMLAWIQVLPEFAVEAVISWHRDVALMTANFTGALRLLTGLGWPMIWLVHALAQRRRGVRDPWPAVRLDREHAVEIVGLTPPLLYFGWIIYKGTLDCWDSAVLLALYAAYLVLLNRIPPRDEETMDDVAAVPRAILKLPPVPRTLAMVALFLAGGLGIYVTVRPFLDSMIGLAVVLGISQFVFIQWVAPFLSEFPEFVSTSNWARSRGKAGMALMNMVSSNVNQWTVLAAMIPIVYSASLGHPATVPLHEHRVELMLTLLQGALGVVLLANFDFRAHEALGLFALWALQFAIPTWREEISIAYAVWLVVEIGSVSWRPGRLRAFAALPELWRRGGRS
jgi:cation:H+ antiporter